MILADDLLDRRSMIDFKALSTWNLELARIEPQLVENCRVNIGDIMAVFNSVEAEFVGRAVNNAPFQAAAGHPDTEAEIVMVPPAHVLRSRGAAELSGKHDERLVKQPAA